MQRYLLSVFDLAGFKAAWRDVAVRRPVYLLDQLMPQPAALSCDSAVQGLKVKPSTCRNVMLSYVTISGGDEL